MNIWSTEIKDIERLYNSLQGSFPNLEKELKRLIATDDENMLLVYSRRCLEVLITQLCETELNRKRGTEPLQRIIDKLNKEEIVPHNIIVSMQNVNSMSTFGAHPKDFEMEQVKPVLHNLKTIIKWYLNYAQEKGTSSEKSGTEKEKTKARTGRLQSKSKSGKRMILLTSILLAVTVIAVVMKLSNFNGKNNAANAASIGSIVVLPFSNYTGQDSLDYFVDGMHSSLITDMGKVGSLRIPGATTSQVFKNSKKTIKEIASELKVDVALETAVMCLGQDSICFQTRLIKPGQEEVQLWTADYKIAKDQILNWYNGITKQIAEEVNVKLTHEEETLLSESRTIDKQVYEDYMKAHYYWGDASRESLQKAREYLNSAIQKEPDWAPLYSGLAQVWFVLQQMGWEQPLVAVNEIYSNIDKALELDPNLTDAHFLKALLAHLVEWDWAKAEKEFLQALAVNPSDAQSRVLYAQLLCVLQRVDEAKIQGELAYELNPLDPYMKIWYSALLPAFGECKKAIAVVEELTAVDPGNYIANSEIFIAAYMCNDYDKVIKAEKYLLPVLSINEGEIKEIERIYSEKGFVSAYEKIMEYLEKFAENNPIAFMDMAVRYIMAEQPEKAMDWIEKGYEMHDPQMTYIATGIYNLKPLFDNPRFIAICEKMNLPVN